MTKEELQEKIDDIDLSIAQYSDIIKAVDDLKKKRKNYKKQIKALEPVIIYTDDETILSIDEVDEKDVRNVIEKGIKEYVNEYIGDVFYETIPDHGVTHTAYFLIGSKVYKTVIDYGAEWVSEWSSRCNIIDTDDYTIESIEEIKEFEFEYNNGVVGETFAISYEEKK